LASNWNNLSAPSANEIDPSGVSHCQSNAVTKTLWT
jgi:hypothetical protein